MIYLDNNATTAVDELVLKEMMPYFNQTYGNASSHLHYYGAIAKDAVENTRNIIAKTIHCTEQEIVFTSGATESLNTAIIGIYNTYKNKGNHIITIQTEHNAVLDTCKYLETNGATVDYLNVDKNGQINLQELQDLIKENTILVIAMLVNNETGIILPIKEIANIVHQKHSILCCDTTQAFGKIEINVDNYGIDLMCISGHKFHGPKGVGALYIRRKNPRVSIGKLIHGGSQENNRRGGTLNVPGIVGLGKATEIANQDLISNTNKIIKLRSYLETNLLNYFGEKIQIVGANTERIHNTSNIIFPITSNKIIEKLYHKVAVSIGSACTTNSSKPSHVLTAMQYSKIEALSAIRFSLSKYNTSEEINTTLDLIKSVV